MGKVFNRRAALGNHQRQRAQATMLLHGWRPFNSGCMLGAGAINEETGQMVLKDAATGKAAIYPSLAPHVDGDMYIEWDEVTTPRVLWLYKVMLREKMI